MLATEKVVTEAGGRNAYRAEGTIPYRGSGKSRYRGPGKSPYRTACRTPYRPHVAVASDAVRLTDPAQAVEFIDKTDIDALAVAIGTNHGQYKSKTNINFDVLKSIYEVAQRPLVIHGGTGVSDNDIHRVIDLGIRKFNVGTELLVQWNRKSKELYDSNKENTSNRNNVMPALDVVQEVVEHKISLFKNI